jgi:hypothetical protein
MDIECSRILRLFYTLGVPYRPSYFRVHVLLIHLAEKFHVHVLVQKGDPPALLGRHP